MAGGMYVPDARANWWDDVWQRRDQQAWQALQNKENDRAAALAVAPGLAGEAWYRSGKFDNASSAWSKKDTADAHYNRGNALAQLGQFDAALQAYDRALQLDPSMEDARFNRDLVEQMKQKQQEQQQQQQDQDQKNGQGDSQQGDSDGKSGQSDESRQAADRKSSEQDQDGKQQQGQEQKDQGKEEQDKDKEQGDQPNYAESWSEEDAQAMEQWLRRIPDDPGGLLRRKFMNEHLRRSGSGDESKP
jgi:Ca-activated chloride channel family protein